MEPTKHQKKRRKSNLKGGVVVGAAAVLATAIAGAVIYKERSSENEAKNEPAQEKTFELKKPTKKSVHRMRWIAGSFAVLMIAVVISLVLVRQNSTAKNQEALKKKVAKGPQLEVVTVKQAPADHELVLEAESRPNFQATIFAKVSGYLREIYVIEGSQVKAGQIMARIDSPETDQAYFAARADAFNKNKIASRYRILLKKRLVSAQEADQSFADARMATAKLRSAQEQKDYELLRAPFDGVVTARLVDPGALIPDASNSKAAQLAVVNLADTTHLKIDGFVEQRYAPDIRVGNLVELYLPDRASERFQARIARVSGVLDPRTRMLFLEMDFDNSAGKIVAGSFVNVALKIRRPSLLQAPIQALVTKNEAPALAVVGPDSMIHLQPIEIFENDGSNVMISSGAKLGERIALDTGVELKEGDAIQAIEADPKKPGGPEAGGARQQQAQNKSGGSKQGQPSFEAGQSGGGNSNVLPSNGTVSATSQSAESAPPPNTGAKQESQSGESQPRKSPMKPSKANTIYQPRLPAEPNE